jgi:hypothetical protein
VRVGDVLDLGADDVRRLRDRLRLLVDALLQQDGRDVRVLAQSGRRPAAARQLQADVPGGRVLGVGAGYVRRVRD